MEYINKFLEATFFPIDNFKIHQQLADLPNVPKPDFKMLEYLPEV